MNVLVATLAASATGSDELTSQDWAAFYLMMLSMPLILLLNKAVVQFCVKRWMFGRSSAVDAEFPSAYAAPERDAASAPVILEWDQQYGEGAQHTVLRRVLVDQVTWALRRRRRDGLVAGACYAVLPTALELAFGGVSSAARALTVPLYGVLLVVLHLWSYWYERGQRFARGRLYRLDPIMRPFRSVLALVASPRFEPIIFVAIAPLLLAAVVRLGSVPFGVGVAVAFTLHLLLMVRAWRTPEPAPNVKLLVLRVFGDRRANVFTFDRLIWFWRWFGTHFTVDDPMYAAHRVRVLQFRTLLQVIGVFAAPIPALAAGLSPLVGTTVAVAAILGSDWLGLIRRRPAQDAGQIRRRIDSVIRRPKRFDGSFRDVRMVCFMNTWRLAVAEMASVADLILMDLRGITERNAGCHYEVDFIFDTFPIGRIVFLRDDKTDQAAVQALLKERYRELRAGSPNENVTAPVLSVYVCRDQDGNDVQALTDILLLAAGAAGRLMTTPAPAQAGG
jgi:hypothetical protein